MLGQNRIIAKSQKLLVQYHMHDINGTSRGMPWPQTGATHYHIQLVSPDKGNAMKMLTGCYVVCLGSMIYRISLSYSARCIGLVHCCVQDGYKDQVSQHPIEY